MRKLAALTDALIRAGAADDSVNSFADQGVLVPENRDLGNGIQVGVFKYDAVIQIENYPDDAYSLLAFVLAWIQTNDPEREKQQLNDPEIDISLNDDRTADVEISVEFEEAIELVLSPDGDIYYNGERYAVAIVPIDVAETLDKMDGAANG